MPGGLHTTRSQRTLPDFFNQFQLQRSPLTNARSTIRNTDIQMDLVDDSEDPLVLSVSTKRPSSPSFFGSGQSSERELKRSKKENGENENGGVQNGWRLQPFGSPRKPSSISGDSSPSYKTIARARSVPPSVPHLDLTVIPPSPWRSPSKERTPMLRVLSVPPPSSPPLSQEFEDNDQTPKQFSRLTKQSNPGPFDFAGLMLAKTPAHRGQQLTFDTPMSPLTPLPPTPWHKATPDSPELSNTPLASAFTMPEPTEISRPSSPATTTDTSTVSIDNIFKPASRPSSRAPSRPPSRPPSRAPSSEPIAHKPIVTPRAPSRLPSVDPVTRPPSSNLNHAETTPNPLPDVPTVSAKLAASKPPSSGAARTKATKSTTVRHNPVPMASRVTRSVALRMKKKDEPISASATQKPRKSMSFSMKPTSTAATAKPKSRPSSPVKPAIPAATPIASSSSAPSTSTSTSTSARKKAIVPPGPPVRPLAFPKPIQTPKPISRPLLSTTSEGGARPASLSNLSTALQKLTLPTPSRPSSSMSMNPSEDGDDIPSTSSQGKSKGKEKAIVLRGVKDDGSIGRKSVAAGKQTALPLKKSSTITSFFTPVSTASSSSSTLTAPTKSSALKAAAAASGSAAAKRPAPIFTTPTNKPGVNTLYSMGPPRTGLIASGMRGRSGLPSNRVFGKLGTGVVGNKIFSRVSQRSELPVVEGSPVKGGGNDMDTPDGSIAGPSTQFSHGVVDMDQEPPSRDGPVDMDLIFGALAELGDDKDSKGKSRQRHDDAWRKNASTRASLASQALSQSLSSLPETPPRKLKGSMGPPPVPGRYPGLRSASSSYPSSSLNSGAQKVETAPGALGNGIGAHVSSGRGESSNGKKKSGSGALKVLKECIIFVDVRTDDGDDAGSLFVDMLKGLGARILQRAGQSCTHIVYKNGLTSTLSRYRTMDDPKPSVVGIAWVVECAEQRAKVDETKFLIDLKDVNVAGAVKRRRSMLPKHLNPTESTTNGSSPPGETSMDSESNSVERSPSIDDEDNLPPLEKARRRRSILVKG